MNESVAIMQHRYVDLILIVEFGTGDRAQLGSNRVLANHGLCNEVSV